MITGTITTRHHRARCVAGALRPDNLASMETLAVDGTVRTTIRSARLRSVIASIDDYLMNLMIAEEICSFDSN
ncbi:MAG: KEOPS complex subunit Pcc1 [Methanoculleaceae archaeon]